MIASSTNSPDTPWRRHALGAISIGMMVGGFLCGIYLDSDRGVFAEGVLIKAGTTLFVGWLAYPQLQKLNWWIVMPTMLTIAILVFRPQLAIPAARLAIFLAPVFFLMWLFKPVARG